MKKIGVYLVSLCNFISFGAVQSAEVVAQPKLKKATIENAASLMQLAQLYTDGPFADKDRAKKLYAQVAAYRRELIKRRKP